MTIVRVGTTKKYSEGWDSAFGKGKKKAEPVAAKGSPKKAALATKTAATKTAPKKAAVKKAAPKKGKKK